MMLKRLMYFLSSAALAAAVAACGDNKCEEASTLACDCPQESAKTACDLAKAAKELADAAGVEAKCEGDVLKQAECALDNKDAYCEASFAGTGTGTAAAGNAYNQCVGGSGS